MRNVAVTLTPKRLRVVVAGLFIILLGYCVWPTPTGPVDIAARDREKMLAEVRANCQEFVRRRLRAPSTAKFSIPGAMHTGPSRYRAAGTYDAQNAFGAMLRGEYVCDVRQNPDSTWTLVKLTTSP